MNIFISQIARRRRTGGWGGKEMLEKEEERKKNKRIREDRDEKIDKVRERIYESSLF